LAASLSLEDDLQVVAEVERGEEVIDAYRAHHPDVVVMDLQLPGISGVEATARLVKEDANAKVLIFSTFARDDEIQTALEAGALGYLQKSAERGELLKALRQIEKGDGYIPDPVAERLAEIKLGPSITSREREILALVAQGCANKEIAARLGIAEDTVKRHVSNTLQKLEVSDRAEATAEAIRRGIVNLGN
ncbi:MAG: response regulator transcription factor, partial [Verrucomicrobiota bacterium]